MGINTLLLAAAATVKIALPAFDVDRGPSILIQRTPEYYASSFESLQCATGIVTSRLGPNANSLFASCEGEPVCLSNIGKQLGFDFILLGKVDKGADEQFGTDLRLVDVREQAVKRRLFHKYRGALSGFEQSVKEYAPTICKAVNPAWKEPEKPKSAEQLLADLQFDTGDLAPKPALTKDTPAPAKPANDFAELPAEPKPVIVAAKPPPESKPVVNSPPPTVGLVTPPVAKEPSPPAVVAAKPLPAKKSGKDAEITLTPPKSSSTVLGFLHAPQSSKARTASVISLGTATVATVLGGAFGGAALSAAGQRTTAGDMNAYYAAQASAESRAKAANVAFGVAGTAAVTTAFFWFLGDQIFGDSSASSAPLAQTTMR